jgi:ferrous iron transport protein A
MFVSDVPAGASFRVLSVVLAGEVGKRLADMGFTEGAEGSVVRGGFLRGPLQVRIRGYDLLLRRSEAAGIEVEPVGDWAAETMIAGSDMARGHGRRWMGGRGPGPGHGRMWRKKAAPPGCPRRGSGRPGFSQEEEP